MVHHAYNSFRRSLVVGISVFFLVFPAPSRAGAVQDFSLWTWLQVEKGLNHHRYFEVQCQLRYDKNASEFNRANYYFIFGKEFTAHWQAEVLYQLNTNHHSDQHTFFGGVTYKQKIIKHFSLYYRFAVQTARNYFSGDPMLDRPYTEFRNRLRLAYKLNDRFSLSLSGEPYIKHSQQHMAYLSRVRCVSSMNCRLNKYQSWSVFYLIEPDVISFSNHHLDYVLGITGHFKLPDKWKGFRKMFRIKSLDGGEASPTDRDPVN